LQKLPVFETKTNSVPIPEKKISKTGESFKNVCNKACIPTRPNPISDISVPQPKPISLSGNRPAKMYPFCADIYYLSNALDFKSIGPRFSDIRKTNGKQSCTMELLANGNNFEFLFFRRGPKPPAAMGASVPGSPWLHFNFALPQP
jgi:hypothetical protein